MSGIYIHGMEMPLEGEYHMTLYVCSDGSAYIDVASFPVDKDRFEAVPVPDHGRLGDLDVLHKLFLEKGKEYKGVGGAMFAAAAWCIANAPTVIPASKEAK